MSGKFPIPDAALARHIAVLGETGSGKTHTAKSIAEHLVDEGYRICILDTIKSDWWGMISSASGKHAGLPFRIIGGPRGHVSLHPGAGKPIGELVAKAKLPLAIVDMADFDAGEPQQFFEDFARALWKNMKGVLYLVIEEAHELAPKERAGFGKENMAVYWAKKLATGSRTKGIRLIISSQRTQAVHNALLGSCGTMIAHSLTLPADQKPVKDWLKASLGDDDLRATIENDLAFLPTGTGWVCCAKERFFEKIHFPKIKTFDNSATPDKDADDFHVTTAAVDPEELRAIIGDAVKEAEANDPALLKKEIVRLHAELRRRDQSQARDATVDDRVADAAHAEGYQKGRASGWDAGFQSGFMDGRAASAVGMSDGLKDLAEKLIERQVPYDRDSIPVPADPLATQTGPTPVHNFAPRKASAAPKPAKERKQVPQNGALDKPLQKIVDAIHWWNVFGIEKPTHPQVAFIAGYRAGTGTWNRYLSALRSSGTIEPKGALSLTGVGTAIANDPPEAPTAEDLRTSVIRKIDAPLAKILTPLLDCYPAAMRHDEAAKASGYAPGTGTWNRYLSSLRSLELIERSGPLKAQDWLFPGGL